jgi:hypothetical protein
MTNPHQFYRDDAGAWHYRAAEEHFSALGLQFELLSNQSLPAVLVENVRFLEDYSAEGRLPLDPDRAKQLADVVRERRCCGLHELLDLGFKADEIYTAIVDGHVYVDLNTDRLADSGELQLFSDQATHAAARLVKLSKLEKPLPIPGTLELHIGSQLKFDTSTWQVIFVSHDAVMLQDENGQRQTYKLKDIRAMHAQGLLSGGEALRSSSGRRIADVPQAALERALARLRAVRDGSSEEFSSRSIARFQERSAHAVTELDKLLALVDSVERRGNRKSRISETNGELIEKAISTYFNQPEIRGYKGVWDKYCGLCKETLEADGKPVRPIGYPAFTRRAAELEDLRARRGKRAEYQVAPIYAAIDNAYPVHGVRPHEVCYIDHTIANIALKSPSGMELGKPTFTLAVDGCTTHPRAQILCFDPPSSNTVLLILRDYVRRHHCLPRVLSIDNGKEFHSRELEFLCTLFGIELRYRPPAQARFGAMVERLLGATEDEVFSELQGNTRAMKDGTRQVTKSVNPFGREAWTLAGLHSVLDDYLFKERPQRIHPALGTTPDAYEAKRLQETGDRPMRFVHYNEDLMLLTSPHPRRSHHKVDRQRGIWVSGIWYHHPAFKDLKKGEKVEVRIEPWHAGVVYAQVQQRWVTATGNCQRWLASRTSREVEIALREERRRATQLAGKASVNPDQRSSRHRLWTPQAFDARLAEQQRETRHLMETLGMTVATKEAREAVQKAMSEPAPTEGLPASAILSERPSSQEKCASSPQPNAKPGTANEPFVKSSRPERSRQATPTPLAALLQQTGRFL